MNLDDNNAKYGIKSWKINGNIGKKIENPLLYIIVNVIDLNINLRRSNSC